MRKAIIIVAALVLLAGLGLPCRAGDAPPPEAAAVWEYITKANPYQNWPQWPDFAGVQPSRSPHGPFVKVYVNQAGADMTEVPAPYGVMQVKEGYTADQKLQNITVMYKVKGFNPEAGDWFWAKYTPQGKAGPAGKPRGCVACHGARADNDYILVHFFK